MQLSFDFISDSRSLHVDIDGNEEEVITGIQWGELYKKAQNNHLPYYWISVAIINSKNQTLLHCYDGTSLEKCKLLHKNRCSTDFLDPLTRLPILKTHNLFLHCFSGNALPLKALSTPTLSSFQFSDLPLELSAISKSGLNIFALEVSENKETIGKIQWIIGSFLLKKKNEDAICWISSASKFKIKEAYTALGLEACLGEIITKDKMLGRSYLRDAITKGDKQAEELLELFS